MNLLKKLENLENVTPNERILIDAILKDPESFIAAKPKEIASLTYVSVPTIYRLINKLRAFHSGSTPGYRRKV